MDSADYSAGDHSGQVDKTTGGVSKLAGLTFGPDEDSFHSEDFDRELGQALAGGTARRQQSKKDRELNRLNNDDQPQADQSTETSHSHDDTDGMVEELGSYLKSKPARNHIPKSGATPLPTKQAIGKSSNVNPSTRLAQRIQHAKNEPPTSSMSRTSPIPKVKPREAISNRITSLRTAAQLANEPNLGDDSNLSMLQTLNDSAAFAFSPPTSPEAFRSGSGVGPSMNQADPKKVAASKKSMGSDAIRTKPNHLTLREQEKVIDEVKKENFNLKLKIYFLEDRLAKLAPDQVDLALKENVEIKVEFQTVRQELKRYKRLLLEAERAIELAKADRDELLQKQQLSADDEQSELRRVKEELVSRNRTNRNLEEELRRLRDRLERVSSKENVTSSRAHQVDDWVKEEHLLEIKNLKNELTEERQMKEDLLGDNQELRHRLVETKSALHETQDEIQRMNRMDEAGHKSDQVSRAYSRLDDFDDHHTRRSLATPLSTVASTNRIKELKRDLDEMRQQTKDLEAENTSLRSQINAQVTMLSTRNGERDKLQDQIHDMKRKIMELEDELERADRQLESHQRGASSQDINDQLRDELNVYRDKLASALLTLERREKEIDELNVELQEREALYSQQSEKLGDEYLAELESVKVQRDELQDLLEERDDQVNELSEQLREVINLQEETDKALQEVSARLQDKEEDYMVVVKELEATQADLKEIGQGNRELAMEVNEKEQQIVNLNTELDELEQDAANRAAVHEQVVAKLKQKLNSTKSELTDLNIQHESCLSEVKFLRDKHEELALRHAEIDEKRRAESDAKRRLEREIDDLERELRTTREEMDLQIIAAKKERRELQASSQLALEAKEKAIFQAQSDLAHAKGRLQVREEDLEKLQAVLKTVETESNRMNESQSHDRFSLELEIERLQRDLASSAQDFEQAKAENVTVRNELRDAEAALSKLKSENGELNDRLEGIQKTRKELNNKFEEQTKHLRETQTELANAKNRLQLLEDELSQEHRQLSKTENQYREQLNERNTLLLTMYQFIDKLVNSGSGTRKTGSTMDAKPFSNFSVFHDSVINRLKSLSAMQSGFDTKIKEVESKLEKQYTGLKRQHDSRMRQLDQLETTIKAAADTQRQWRARLTTKQGEVEAARETCNELQKQISSLKQRASMVGESPGSITEQRQTVNRVSHLEKRLLATQAQLKATEEKFGEAKVKVATVEASWQARLKELQERNRELEEKVKRERQGAKERKNELDHQVRSLKEQVEAADRRGRELETLLKNSGSS